MGQITIYLDSETEKKMINMVIKSGKSKSKWIADLIREKISGSWPENIINLAGAWSDLPNGIFSSHPIGVLKNKIVSCVLSNNFI